MFPMVELPVTAAPHRNLGHRLCRKSVPDLRILDCTCSPRDSPRSPAHSISKKYTRQTWLGRKEELLGKGEGGMAK